LLLRDDGGMEGIGVHRMEITGPAAIPLHLLKRLGCGG